MRLTALDSAPWLCAMARVFDNAGAPLFLVGGGVRNPLMGLPMSDADVCGPLPPDGVCAICEGTPVTARVRAAGFGTVELWVDGHMAEYTTWRRESYGAGHRPDSVTFTTDIREDALRRDFSANALYQQLHDGWLGDVIDPTGGLRRLRMGVLHTTTPDPDDILCHDGQRILRAARFQAEMDLRPTQRMMESLHKNAALIRDVAMEQLRPEVDKILMADLRYPALQRRDPASRSGLFTLHQIGAWDWLFDGTPYDDEAALSLRRLRGTLEERMALLLRSCPDVQGTLLRLKYSARQAARTNELVRVMNHLHAPLYELADPEALAFAARAHQALGNEPQAQLARQAMADLRGKPLTLRQLALSGDDLKPVFMQKGLPLSRMGQTLQALWRAAVSGDVENTPEALWQQVQKMGL